MISKAQDELVTKVFRTILLGSHHPSVTEPPTARITPEQFQDRAFEILHNMALENSPGLFGLRRIFRRWFISDEPLRRMAADLLREAEYHALRPIGTCYVGGNDYGYGVPE